MPFKKGQSGNPGGRPKEVENIKELAREYSAEAIKRLVSWMRSKNPRASVLAANALLDRGYGKPAQFVTDDTAEFEKHMGERELAEAIAREYAELGPQLKAMGLTPPTKANGKTRH